MKILLIEPFYTGSHERWSFEYQKFSKHEVHILSLPGRHWKWRMHGAAVTLANQFNKEDFSPDFILVSDMLDLTTFLALTRDRTAAIPVAIYFHENQITYPWSPTDSDVKLKRDNHYAFINYTSALASNALFFNSNYHKNSFLDALPNFLNQFPDYKNEESITNLKNKSEVLYLGMDLAKFDSFKTSPSKGTLPTILWNHRWEYDKNPTLFFNTLFKLKEENIAFQLIVLGESFKTSPDIFKEAEKRLKEEIIHFGFTENFEEYAHLLWTADILPVTNFQDFFGGSVVEAIYCNCYPILPKRLAYPEHVPIESAHKYFYSSEEEFYSLLKTNILTIGLLRQNAHSQNFVSKYDWSNLAKHYDSCFESLTKNKR